MNGAAYLLLVEDNPGDARLTEEMFREAPAGSLPPLRWVDTARAAVQRLADEPGCGAVLLDLSLPDSYGLDTLHAIKSHARDIPIIVLSGNDDDELALAAVMAGAQDYLVKGSFDATLLRRALQYAGHRKRAEVALLQRALHDELTGAPRRSLLLDRLHIALTQAERNAGKGAVLFVDLDHFKKVNDSLGHAAGDTVLKESWRRLVASVRARDTVARFGGDEFVVLLPELAQAEDALIVGHKLQLALAAPLAVAGRTLTLGASIGVVGFSGSAVGAEALLEQADRAMYRAKSDGRGRVVALD